MLKLSKKTEYALMAVRHMAVTDCCVSAKEISEQYKIPYELLAKVMQMLVKQDIVISFQGSRGGYKLAGKPCDISIFDIILAVNPDFAIIDCINDKDSITGCSHLDCCQIRNPLIKVQQEVNNLFKNIKIDQLV